MKRGMFVKCGNCGSQNVVVLSETNSKGYGFGKACLGFLCWGPIGLLCGLLGVGTTKNKKLC